jgi:hypothetical protein
MNIWKKYIPRGRMILYMALQSPQNLRAWDIAKVIRIIIHEKSEDS